MANQASSRRSSSPVGLRRNQPVPSSRVWGSTTGLADKDLNICIRRRIFSSCFDSPGDRHNETDRAPPTHHMMGRARPSKLHSNATQMRPKTCQLSSSMMSEAVRALPAHVQVESRGTCDVISSLTPATSRRPRGHGTLLLAHHCPASWERDQGH